MSDSYGVKVAHGRRLAWYLAEPDEQFWQQHWNRKIVPGYHEQARRHVRSDELAAVLLRTFPPGSRVLEAGCGAGWYVAALGAADYDVDGIEYAEGLVRIVNAAEPGLPVRRGDALAVDADDASYDAYLSIGVVEHRFEGPEPFFAEAWRVLRPGGRAVFTVPAYGPVRRTKARLGRYRTAPPDEPFFQWGFRADEFADLVRDGGFRVDWVGYQHLYRMLVEEVPGYWRMTMQRGGHRARRAIDRLVGARDGHMVLVTATKPG